MQKRTLLKATIAGAAALMLSGGATMAQEVTLRLHQFLPPPAPVPAQILKPWAQGV